MTILVNPVEKLQNQGIIHPREDSRPSLFNQADTYDEKIILTTLFLLDKGSFFISPLRWLFPTTSNNGEKLEGGLVNCHAEEVTSYQSDPAPSQNPVIKEETPPRRTPNEMMPPPSYPEFQPEICDGKDNNDDGIIDNIPISVLPLGSRERDIYMQYQQWSPDGSRIAFSKWNFYTDEGGLYSIKPDGTDEKKLYSNDVACFSWLKEGGGIVFRQWERPWHLLMGHDDQDVQEIFGGYGSSFSYFTPHACPFPNSPREDIRFLGECPSSHPCIGFQIKSLNTNTKEMRTLADFCPAGNDDSPVARADLCGSDLIFPSPDREKLALLRKSLASSEWSKLYVFNADGTNIRLLAEGNSDFEIYYPVTWLSDNRRLIFDGIVGECTESWLLNTESGEKQRLQDNRGNRLCGGIHSASPDGDRFLRVSTFNRSYWWESDPVELFSLNTLSSASLLFKMSLLPPHNTQRYNNGAVWSPDGRWIAVSEAIRGYQDFGSKLTMVELPCPGALNAPPVWTGEE